LSAAIAACLAREHGLREAVAEGKGFVTRAIEQGFRVGQGQGVLHHFWEYYGPEGLP
jgi:hydroxymethylpyrimidine/phosphomethylpyrimidine kinase